MKLRCGKRDVEALKAILTNYLTSILYPEASKPMVDGFGSNFQGISRICSMVHSRILKLLCTKEAKLEPFISFLFYTGCLYKHKIMCVLERINYPTG